MLRTRFRRYAVRVSIRWRALWLLVFCAASACAGAQAITSEPLRLAALRAIFPGTTITPEPGKRINHPAPEKEPGPPRPTYPDAFAGEPVYRVTGPAANEIEQCASQSVVTTLFSEDREVRVKLFHWPGKPGSDLLAIAQYKFQNEVPAAACWSIGLLVRLVATGGSWRRQEAFLLETARHMSIQRVELIDLTGSGDLELIVESDFGAPGTVGSSLQVFSLGAGKFDEILNKRSRLESGMDEGYTQVLNVPATRAERGKRFHIAKTTYFENEIWLRKPRVTSITYERGAGVDKENRAYMQESLAPLR